MREQLKTLHELQVIDLGIAKTQKAKASLDDGSAKRRQVEAARQAVGNAEKLFHEVSAEMRDKELTLKSVETKRKTFRDKLYGGGVSNPKELSSMEQEIEMLGRQKDKLEENIIELLDTVEQRKSEQAKWQAALKQQEDEFAAHLEKLRQDVETLTHRLKELSAEREKAVPAVDPALLKKYEATRVRSGGVVVSKAADNNCSACHTQILTGMMRDLKSDKELLTCDNCGRLLYLEQ